MTADRRAAVEAPGDDEAGEEDREEGHQEDRQEAAEGKDEPAAKDRAPSDAESG